MIPPFPLRESSLVFRARIHRTMTSADSSLPLGCETSHGKLYPLPVNMHDLPPVITLDFGLLDLLLNYPNGRPYIMFLFVISTFCLTLPSDSSLRRTPLRLANDPCQVGAFGTLTLLVYSMHGIPKKGINRSPY